MDTTTSMRDMTPMASAEGSGPGMNTRGTSPSRAATVAAASPSLVWLMETKAGVRPYFS